MARPLRDVKSPADLRDLIQKEWDAYAKRFGINHQVGLFSTYAGDNAGGPQDRIRSPSHVANRAIDLIPSDHRYRRVLVDFGLFVGWRNPEVTVLAYRSGYEPHVHFDNWKEGYNRPSVGVNLGKKGSYATWLKKNVPANAAKISQAFKEVALTFPESPFKIDHDKWAELLKTSPTAAPAAPDSPSDKGNPDSRPWWHWLIIAVLPMGLLSIAGYLLYKRLRK